ncbi:response regulator [Proteobacteria bacterium 005FR1]|nr:response regulator [Proteobacteria bacterium 005FR1]
MSSKKGPMDRKLAVILVEDDSALLSVWTQLFEMLGHSISGFQTGAQLLARRELVDEHDLVITDYYLPDLNGVDLIKDLRITHPQVPAIVLTGSRETFIREAAEKIPACHILYKPLNIGDIECKIAEILQLRN